jgi:hypothetical protein
MENAEAVLAVGIGAGEADTLLRRKRPPLFPACAPPRWRGTASSARATACLKPTVTNGSHKVT